MSNFYSKLKFVHWLYNIDLLQTSEHLKIVNFIKFLKRGVTASFIVVQFWKNEGNFQVQ